MKNITLSIQEDILKASRQYAKTHNTSVNALIRTLLEKVVHKDKQNWWVDECLGLMAKAKGHSHGKKWKREDLYDG